MPHIKRIDPPDASLLAQLQATGQYADCFTTQISRRVTHAEFIEAFYTTRLFKLERFILHRLARLPSTDAEVTELAQGQRIMFAAWRVAERAKDEILLTDLRARTSSWLMVVPARSDKSATDLYFGSAIKPRRNRKTGASEMGPGFRWLLGFHVWYSRALLRAAARRLIAGRAA